jgi:hypothetical protein
VPVWALQVITIVSTCGGIGATITALVQAYRREQAEWRVKQLLAEKHAGRFHRCHEHDSIAIGGMDERSADLTEIGRRNMKRYQNRQD